VQIFGVHREPSGPAVGHGEEDADGEKTAGEEDEHAQQKGRANGGVALGHMLPAPDDPGEGLVNGAGAQAQQRSAQGGLMLGTISDVLGAEEIGQHEHQ
jgi:hypothetical protein